jgi:hypothetical protein
MGEQSALEWDKGFDEDENEEDEQQWDYLGMFVGIGGDPAKCNGCNHQIRDNGSK